MMAFSNEAGRTIVGIDGYQATGAMTGNAQLENRLVVQERIY
jgi:hypothetical protein